MNSKYVESLEDVLQLEGSFVKKLPSNSRRWWKSYSEQERSRHSVNTGGPPFVPKRTWNTSLLGARATRLDVCAKEAKYEIGESHRGRT